MLNKPMKTNNWEELVREKFKIHIFRNNAYKCGQCVECGRSFDHKKGYWTTDGSYILSTHQFAHPTSEDLMNDEDFIVNLFNQFLSAQRKEKEKEIVEEIEKSIKIANEINSNSERYLNGRCDGLRKSIDIIKKYENNITR